MGSYYVRTRPELTDGNPNEMKEHSLRGKCEALSAAGSYLALAGVIISLLLASCAADEGYTGSGEESMAPAGSSSGSDGKGSTDGVDGSRGESPDAMTALEFTSGDGRSDSSALYESSQTALLSAGEIDDNERWNQYLDFRSRYSGPAVHDVDVSERYVITVTDSAGLPIHNSEVQVSVGSNLVFEGRTYTNGQTLFFPRAFSASEGAKAFNLKVSKGDVSHEQEVARDPEQPWNVSIDLEQTPTEGMPLDILFLLDATGSMADEIDQIKNTLLSIASRISDLPSKPDLRFGMVAYRDRGDDFVTRVYDFSDDVESFRNTIRSVRADGGNDEPESLNEAYRVAIHEPEWRLANAVRLIFLIADAPPHLDYANDYDYAQEMMVANGKGIKTHAIASSGLDVQGEYIFRQIAQHTMGRFVFIVYGPDGTTTHDVGEYTVDRLDDIVVSLVEDEMSYLPH